MQQSAVSAAADGFSALQKSDLKHHFHPFTAVPELAAKGPRIITRAEGSYIFTDRGEKILDGMAGLWCVNAGYGRQRLVEAAKKQMEQLPYYNHFFQCSTPPAVKLAEKLASLLPEGLDRFHFVNSGTEANDTIIKTIWYYWNLMDKPQKKIIIGRELGYHGVGLGSGSLTGMDYMHGLFDLPIKGFSHIKDPYAFIYGQGMSEEEFASLSASWLEQRILELGPDKVAAFIAEPVQGAGGVIIPPKGYWEKIQEICHRYDLLLVADEVICGFGRTGNWFGSETFSIKPDMMTLAKGLSSGYLPIAAVAIGRTVGDAMAASTTEYAHGVTYSGHPAAAAVALENLHILEEEKLYCRASGAEGEHFQRAVAKLGEHELIGEIRCCGFLAAMEIVKDKKTNELFEKDLKVGNLCRDISVECGLVMRAIRDGMVLSPPLSISHEEIDELAFKAKKALDLTKERLSG